MPLPLTNLDDRSFQALLDEARARIPAFTPEWTNLNDSDPGMTLAQLHAWLTETLLYRVNRLPDLAYESFLNLIGTTPAPARAAQAELTFRLANLDRAGDPLTVLVPKGAQVGVNDPALPKPLVFETVETLTAVNAAIAAVVVPSTEEDGAARRLVGQYDAEIGTLSLPTPFLPFGRGALEPEMLVGLLLRPFRKKGESFHLDRWPEGELNLTVLVPEVFGRSASGEVIEGPLGTDCPFPWEVRDASGDIEWAVLEYPGTTPDLREEAGWRLLPPRGDDTGALSRSGHVYLDLPADLPLVSFSALGREVWAEMGLRKPPSTKEELIADLNEGIFVAADLKRKVWTGPLGLTDPPLQDLAALVATINDQTQPPPDFAAVDPADWAEVGYSVAPTPHPLLWLRAQQIRVPDVAPEVEALLLNTVRAIAATSRSFEVLGTSAGRPNEAFRLQRAPVLIDPATGRPDLSVAVVPPTGGDPVPWELGEDFHGAGRETPRYLLDPEAGEIMLGDGVHGMIPVAGSRIVALRYRVGGGQIGNVGPGTVSALKTALPLVKSVTNHRAAAGGSRAESIEEAKLRAPQRLRSRDRAVTAEDFADLALRTPGVALKSAHALPLTRIVWDGAEPILIDESPGAVTVVVLPLNAQPTPQPSEAELRLICAHLNARRLITTELYVTGPTYTTIQSLRAEVIVRPDADLKAAQDACAAALLDYFHPLRGGEDGQGWPFGGAIYHGSVFSLLLRQPGVAHVPDLRIALLGQEPDDTLDVLAIPPGSLVELRPSALTILARYGRG